MISQIVGSISSFALYVIDSMGYFGVFLLMALESFNIPIPSEVIMPFAGFLAAKGSMSFWWVVALGVVGNLVGSIFNYYLGYFGGRSFLIKFGKYFFVHEKDLVLADKWFARFGLRAVFFSRMLPVIRTFISLPAGITKVPFIKFATYTFLGVIPWSIALTYVGFYLGERWDVLHVWFQKLDWLIVVAIILAILWWIFKHRKFIHNVEKNEK
ncbi:MAG: DedA family protein [Patescibacteria group bacterium]